MDNRNTLTALIIGIVVVAIIIFGVLYYQKQNQEDTGGIYIGVTDASLDINNVNDIDMSVKKVEVYSTMNGWTTVGSNSKTYSLLSLKNNSETKLYAKANVPSGTYNKVRVTLGDTTVRTKNNGDIKASSPARQVVVSGNIKVNKNEDTHVKLDFIGDKSVHVTSDGQYVFAPVVHTEARSNTTVTTSTGDKVDLTGGVIDSNTSTGVDLDGSSRLDFELVTDNSLQVGAVVGDTLNFMLNGKNYTSNPTINNEGSVNNTTNSNNSGTNTTGGNNTNNNATNGIDINTNLNTNVTGSQDNATGTLNANVNLGY